jgi:hypothetical protein
MTNQSKILITLFLLIINVIIHAVENTYSNLSGPAVPREYVLFESGWGISVDTQGLTRVVVAFIYDEYNQPRWSISQSNNDLLSRQQSLSVGGACPWCEYTAPINNQNGDLELSIDSFRQLTLGISQTNGVSSQIQWFKENSVLVKLTD